MAERTCSIPECEKPARKRGWCQMHYWRFRKYGSTDNPRPTFEERFWAKVDKSGGEDACWLWAGAKSGYGYGTIGAGGKYGRTMYAHRVSYELNVGPIPEGYRIDHKCYTPACVNPSHLHAVTQAENGQNRKGLDKSNTSGARGVHLHKPSGLWVARACANGVEHFGGYFKTIEEAAEAARELRNRVMTNNLADRAS